MTLADLWLAVDAALRRYATEGATAQRVVSDWPGTTTAGFWPGDGDELLGALYDAGWRCVTYEAPYLWRLADPTGAELGYCEGDLTLGAAGG